MGIAIIVSFARLAQTASNNDSTKMPAHYVGNNSVIVMSLRVNILNFIIDLGSCDEKTIDFTRKHTESERESVNIGFLNVPERMIIFQF